MPTRSSKTEGIELAAKLSSVPMMILDADLQSVIFANRSAENLAGYDAGGLLGKNLYSLFSSPTQQDHARDIFRDGNGVEQFGTEVIMRRLDNKLVRVRIVSSSLSVERNKNSIDLIWFVDATKCGPYDSALGPSDPWLNSAYKAVELGIMDIDLASGEIYWSEELRGILGVTNDVPSTLDQYLECVHKEDTAFAQRLIDAARRGDILCLDEFFYRIIRQGDDAVRWIASRGHLVRNGTDLVVRVIITSRDITAEKETEDLIKWSATHDSVTGLPNRALFRIMLERELGQAAEGGRTLALMLVDLDHFKQINDTLGHQAGDRALAQFARCLLEAVPPDAFAARLGGDEFGVVLSDADCDLALRVAGRLSAALNAPFDLGSHKTEVAASCGASCYPADGKTLSRLIRSADLALYAAKKNGGDRITCFTPELRAERSRQLAMLRHARTALTKNMIFPHYQPQILLATGGIGGFEALLRWQHPSAGTQGPNTIASAFEDGRTAIRLGAVMAEAALTDIARWTQSRFSIRKIALNVSAAELRDPTYASLLLARLRRHALPAGLLEIEITETAFFDDRAIGIINNLVELRAAGVSVALDDFGTGYSSLSHLRNLPVDTIKIDRSFVEGITCRRSDRSISKAVLELGAALGMTTIAEGVETAEQAAFLRENGCTLAQGFFFSPPVAARQVDEVLIVAEPFVWGACSAYPLATPAACE